MYFAASARKSRPGFVEASADWVPYVTRELRKRYTASVTGQGTSDGRPCWKLELKARELKGTLTEGDLSDFPQP